MKLRLSFLCLFLSLVVGLSWTVANAEGGDSDEPRDLSDLYKQIKELKARVEKLEAAQNSASNLIIDRHNLALKPAIRPIPSSKLKRREINGIPYYVMPLGEVQ